MRGGGGLELLILVIGLLNQGWISNKITRLQMLCDLVKRQMYEVTVIGADLGCTM